ncbi:zinc finger protein 564 [Parasteatoda tepidariorum]|uniref:zinc finger protein 564 n=1 Tax=Parasteatoda tepidariorum TaxID=114398 RepID=UPI00077FBACE|nr:zinc finger protein 84 [Parasteatoda tepidariorum]XP_015920077.1 zinc finger protein 84 [Parasteatoda tepidariorum]
MMTEVTLQDVYTLQIRRQSNMSNPSPYCEACKNGFVHVNSIQVRQFTQTGKLPGVCRSCNNSFLRICRLQIRHLTHSESHPHVCPICNKSFTHAGNIKKHMLLHEQGDGQSEDLPNNITKTLASGKPKPPFECRDCGRVFIKHGSFLKHCDKHKNCTDKIDLDNTESPMVQENEIPPKPVNGESTIVTKVSEKFFPCEQCNRSFTSQKYLIRHYQSDHEAEFPCQVCEKAFKTRPLLSSHMRSHKHICKLCKKSFTLPEDLELHLQNHVQEQVEVAESKKSNHVCSVCQKGFVHLNGLRKHFLTHTAYKSSPESPKPQSVPKPQAKVGKKHKIYRCQHCSKYYKFRRTLNKHVAESHSE